MNTNKIWGIIGAGWLGSEVIIRLKNAGTTCWETHRKTFTWETNNFPSQPFDILLLNVPPLTTISPTEFVNKIHLKQNQKLIFISSISVYGELAGTVDENTLPKPTSLNGKWLHEVEQLLLQNFKSQITIIRAGGLIGGQRHPIFSLSKDPSKIIKDGPINLIHRKDLIEIIFTISKLTNMPTLVNAVSPHHPLKSIYYNSLAKDMSLNALNFDLKAKNQRIIDSRVLPLIYPDWLCLKLDKL